jgi:hypothetical protein
MKRVAVFILVLLSACAALSGLSGYSSGPAAPMDGGQGDR